VTRPEMWNLGEQTMAASRTASGRRAAQRLTLAFLVGCGWLLGFGPGASSAQEQPPVLGRRFSINQDFKPAIDKAVGEVRARIAAERSQGKLIAYLSFPAGSADGGPAALRREMADFLKKELESRYGPDRIWVFVPEMREFELPRVGNSVPGSDEYHYFALHVLAGERSLGEQFDFVYFPRPNDLARFFGAKEGDRLTAIERFVERRAGSDPEFKKQVADRPEARREFVAFYGIHVGPASSASSRDEWNVCASINRMRAASRSMGPDRKLSMYFDGRPVPPPALAQ